jgi:hypothetical protein
MPLTKRKSVTGLGSLTRLGSNSCGRVHRIVVRANALAMSSNEAFSRARIDEQLRDAGWSLTDGRSIHSEHPLPDLTRADCVHRDRLGG